MHCNSCGCVLQPGEQFCPGCGRPVVAAAPPPIFAPAPIPPPMYIASGQPNGKATASMICGLFFCIPAAAIAAIVFGHLALSEIKASGGRLLGHGRAMTGLILGYIGVAAIPFVLIVAAIAIPTLLRQKIAANEASAVQSMRAINSAQILYYSQYPKIGYACKLSDLGGSSSAPSSEAAGLIDAQLASGAKSGYSFQINGCTSDADGTISTYQVIALPLQRSASGRRQFCSDQTGVIKATIDQTEVVCSETGTPIE